MPDITMPSLGADMDAGTLLEWRVAVGDHVKRGDIIGLVETQKATMEIESYVDGVIDSLVIEAGTKVPVGTVLAHLRGDGEATLAPAPAPVPVAAPAPIAAPAPAPAPAPQAAERVRSSPAARKLARELGVDVATLHGSGPHGAIVLRDVHAPVPPPPLPQPAPPAPAPPAPAKPSGMRDAIAAAMSRSKREIPHYYLAHTISMKRALAWLAETNAHLPIQERILPGALLLRAVALALWEVPELNGFWVDGAYQGSEEVHLGTAIALRTGGLIAPAILDADEKPLPELMRELHDLVARTRAGRLRSSELTAATITVTSLGDRGCETVFPVINPPQVAIIGFGSIVQRPWVEGNAVVPHPTVVATLAADHRVSDGHRGGLFLSALDHILQEPEKL
ncbi:MAG TPA: dihydrolipoamide acetyltransferase family protein [Kofleriaceae bacterium]|nr:dihydrolipoamide acetyltransferase family protein [Kofleriaceae bacterium]